MRSQCNASTDTSFDNYTIINSNFITWVTAALWPNQSREKIKSNQKISGSTRRLSNLYITIIMMNDGDIIVNYRVETKDASTCIEAEIHSLFPSAYVFPSI